MRTAVPGGGLTPGSPKQPKRVAVWLLCLGVVWFSVTYGTGEDNLSCLTSTVFVTTVIVAVPP